MTQEIINALEMLVNDDDYDNLTYYAITVNNYILELEKHKSEFVDTSCIRCKNVNDCSLCENVKNKTGMKLGEMSFHCFESKDN